MYFEHHLPARISQKSAHHSIVLHKTTIDLTFEKFPQARVSPTAAPPSRLDFSKVSSIAIS